MLAPSSGMSEDPITGSLNSAIALWLHQQGRLTVPLLMAQGQCIDRHGRVYISPDGQQNNPHKQSNTPPRVLIGGDTHILIEGTVQL